MQIPLEVIEALLATSLQLSLWPFFRIAGVVMVAPVFGARLVPMRVRMALSVAATVVIAPLVPVTQPFDLSLASGFTVLQEVLIGVAIGFCLQMIFDALIIAGQTIAMSMGLGLATMVDPQRGISVPVVSQFFVILGLLIFLALGGHLATVRLIADSFELLPRRSADSAPRRRLDGCGLGQPDVRGRAAYRVAGGDGAADREHRVRRHEPRRARR